MPTSRIEWIWRYAAPYLQQGLGVSIDDQTDPELGKGVFVSKRDADPVSVYENGLAQRTLKIRFDDILEFVPLNLRDLMLAGKQPETPVVLALRTRISERRLRMHLYTYTTLASMLPYILPKAPHTGS